jgi:hypothetical protein
MKTTSISFIVAVDVNVKGRLVAAYWQDSVIADTSTEAISIGLLRFVQLCGRHASEGHESHGDAPFNVDCVRIVT